MGVKPDWRGQNEAASLSGASVEGSWKSRTLDKRAWCLEMPVLPKPWHRSPGAVLLQITEEWMAELEELQSAAPDKYRQNQGRGIGDG